MAQTVPPVTQLNELTKGIECAILTTVRTDGTLHSCPMATQPADGDGAIWFFSGNHSEKVEAIKTDARVNLAYSEAHGLRYVSVSGNCELVRDHVKARELWNPAYKAWFPSGLDDPNLILLRVLVLEVEYWDSAQGRMVPLAGFVRLP